MPNDQPDQRVRRDPGGAALGAAIFAIGVVALTHGTTLWFVIGAALMAFGVMGLAESLTPARRDNHGRRI